MEPDTAPVRLDVIDRGHLRDPRDASHVINRYPGEFAPRDTG
jgi:hypothetical protein